MALRVLSEATPRNVRAEAPRDSTRHRDLKGGDFWRAIPAFKDVWAGIGDSIVVVGGDGIWNCHIHTDDIGAAVEAALDCGRPRQIRVTDLVEQVEEERWVREGVAAGAEPVKRCRHGDRTGVAVIAEQGADFFDALTDIGRIGESVAGDIDLIDVEGPRVDQRAERFAAAFSLTGGDRNGRTIPEPGIAGDIFLPQRLFEPFNSLFGESVRAAQRGAGVPDAAGVDQQRRVVS